MHRNEGLEYFRLWFFSLLNVTLVCRLSFKTEFSIHSQDRAKVSGASFQLVSHAYNGKVDKQKDVNSCGQSKAMGVPPIKGYTGPLATLISSF